LHNLIIVDDDVNFLSALKRNLERYQFHVDTCSEPTRALDQLFQIGNVDLLILDLTMPDFDGVELMQALARRNNPTPILLISGWWSETLELCSALGKGLGLNIVGALQKPFDLEQLVHAIHGGPPAKIS
jgi:DNA-binding response OmpR family regulator